MLYRLALEIKMNHELEPKPEHIYDEYMRAEERLRTMKQAQRALPDLALEDVQDMTAQRQKGVDREIQRLDETLKQANEYAASNLQELKEQATQEARSAGKKVNPI